jgi:hypothetical protein
MGNSSGAVLIVDDDRNCSDSIRAVLDREGYGVESGDHVEWVANSEGEIRSCMFFRDLQSAPLRIPVRRPCALWTSRVSFLITVGFLLFTALIPGYSQSTGPSFTSIQPPGVIARSGAVTVTITGTGFDATAVVFSAPLSLPTIFINSNTLQATIPDAQVAIPGTRMLFITNKDTGQNSGFQPFYVYSPLPPAVTSIVPAGEYQGSTTPILFIGQNLTGATVSFSGTGISWDQSTGYFMVTADAPLGPQQVTISTPSGSTATCGSGPCTFQVIDSGTWQDLLGAPAGATIRLLNDKILFAGGSTKIFDPLSGQWTDIASNLQPSFPSGLLLPDGRALVGSQIFDPSSGTWTKAGPTDPGVPVLLASGVVFLESVSIDRLSGTLRFSGTLFDPVSGTSRPAPGLPLTIQNLSMLVQPLIDGKLLLIGGNGNNLYDPVTGTFTTVPPTGSFQNGWTRILPDGRILVRTYSAAIGPFTPAVSSLVYDPQANTVVPLTSFDNMSRVGSIFGDDMLLPSGQLLINGAATGRTNTGGFIGLSEPILYDPSKDAFFPQLPVPGVNLKLTTLLADGRVLGYGNTSNGQTGFQMYTPASFENPSPVIYYVKSIPANKSGGGPRLKIHGSGFTPNTSVFAGQNRLVTLYFGSTQLVAFVPPALQTSIASGIVLSNSAPGGGSTLPIRPGATATAPLPINDVETGSIRTGYVVVTRDANSPAPVATLTYGIVQNAVVQSQASILPAGPVLDTTISVDIVPAAGRNLGVAIANLNRLPAAISLTLRDDSGTTISTVAQSLAGKGQLAKFVTELFATGVIGAAFSGSLEVQSSLPVSLIGLRFSGQAFSTVPIPGASAPASSNIFSGGSNPIVFPQFAQSGGWATTLNLLNNTSGVMSGRVDIFDSAGNPLTLSLNGVQASTFTYSIPAQGDVLLAPRDANGQSPF